MSWIPTHKHRWRIAILVLSTVAIIGPWTFDRFWVPLDLHCSPPYFRLDQDYCGIPLSGLYFFRWILLGASEMISDIWAGGFPFTEWMPELAFLLLFSMILLPFAATLIILILGENLFRQVITIIAWGVAIGLTLFIAFSGYPRLFWHVWGIWAFIGLAFCGLVLEYVARNSRSWPHSIKEEIA